MPPPEEETNEEIQFDDLAKLSNRDIQTIVLDLEEKDLAIALRV